MNKKALNIMATACLIASTSFAVSSCRHNSSEETIERPDVDEKDLDPVDLENGTDAITIEQLNELILNPDDLTPGKAVGALKMLHGQIGQSEGARREETMRKFVDLYGILMDIHGDNLRTSIRRLKSNSGVDLETIYADYAATLNVGDEIGGDAAEDAAETPQAEITTVNDQESADEADKAQADQPKAESTSTTSAEEPEATISTFGD